MERKNMAKRWISMLMSLVLLMQTFPLVQIASAEELTNEIPEMELPEEILSSDVFYLSASTAVLNEEGGTYLLRIARGGDCASESGVTVRIADYTAKYGRDYTVSLWEEREKAYSPRDNESLLEKMEGEEYIESPMLTEEEYAEMLASDSELQALTEQGIQEAIDFIESEVSSGDTAGEPLATLTDAMPGIAEGTASETEIKETPATPADETISPLQAARAMYTGIDGEPQEVTADTDTLQQIQDVADIITQAVGGAALKVDFASGEREKHIAVKVKDNQKGDGDRYFYFMLSDPDGTTTNSAASSCAFTILDDEEQTPSEVSFTRSAYTTEEGGDTVSVEIVREGALNTMASVHLSASSDEAMVGRDFSPVDTDVVFPIGIDRRTIDIPVCTEYLGKDAGVMLTLDEASGCTVVGESSEITLMPETPLMGAAEEAYSLSDIVVGNPVNISTPIKTGQSGHYNGHNYYNGSAWDLMWCDNVSDWDAFWHGGYNGTVGARWKITDGNGYDIAGAQVDWDRSGSHAEMTVGFITCGNVNNTWNSYVGKKAYESTNGFNRQTRNFFSNKATPVHVTFFNYGRCDDCNHLYIYGIKPIYRPFVLQFDSLDRYNPADEVKFLNADGSYSAWNDATFLAIAGAVNNLNDQVVRYTKEGKNAVAFMQSINNNNTAPYVSLSRVDAVDIDNNSTTTFASFNNVSSSNVYNASLTSNWVNRNHSYISFEDNTVSNWQNPLGTSFGMRGRIYLRAHFKYKDATVKLIKPNNDIGYVKMSGTSRNVSQDTSYTYHMGDVIKLETVINDEYEGIYEPAGYLVSYKQNATDTAWVRYQTTLSMDQFNGTAAYLDENQRLRYGYYEVMPLYQLVGNIITVRVKATDLGYFDSEYGLFALGIEDTDIANTTIDGVTYLDYPVYINPVTGKNYALTARLASGAPSTGYITWKESGKAQQYVGETFFYASSNNKDANIVTLSFNRGASGSSQRYISVSGQVTHPTYNMVTHQVSTAGKEPAEGALVNFGSGFGVAGADGSFTISPFKVPFDTGVGAYLRYVISLNGEELLKEVKLSTGYSSVQTVQVLSKDEEGEDVITTKSATVYRQTLQEQGINVENGSILNGITVTPDSSVTYSGSVITVDGSGEMTINATVPTGYTYTKYSVDANGKVTETKNCAETVTGIDFLICDADTHQVVKSYVGEKINATTFRGKLESSSALPGNELYLRVTTDRSRGVYTGSVAAGGMNSTVYTNAFTGYTFIQKTTDPVPVLQCVTLPANMTFESLPLIGDTAMRFDLPFCSVGSIKTDTGYKMYIGVSVTQIADVVNKTHMSSFAADDGAYYKSIFSMKNPIQSFGEGLLTTYQNAFGKNAQALYEGNTASLGSPQWKVDVQLGVYFDFVNTKITDPNTNETHDECIFTGVGGFIGVSAGVKMAWYTLIPVVFIPAYFGIEIGANVMGFFGAGTDTSQPILTYENAKYSSLDYKDKLGEFSASVGLSATVQVYVGVGLAGTIGGRGGGTFNAMALWAPSDLVDDWGCALTFTLGMWIDLFLFTIPLQYSFPSIKFGSFEQYGSLSQDVQPVVTTGVALRQPYSAAAPNWTANDPILQAGFSEVSTQVIETNGYEHPDVQLLSLSDGTIFMAFLDTDLTHGMEERTVLKFVMYKNGQWTTPVAVQNDGRADFQPSACEMKDGKVMLAWLSGDPAKATPDAPEDYLFGLEVFTTVVDTTDGVNGAVIASETTRLTDDAYFDYTPTCIYDPITENRAVYYVKTDGIVNGEKLNSAAELVNSYANGCAVTYMLYSQEDGKWLFDKYYDNEVGNEADRQELLEKWNGQRFLANPIPELGLDVPNVADFTAVTNNGLAVYVYTIDRDSSNDTPGDKELFLQFCDLDTHKTYKPIRLTNDSVCDALPKLVSVKRSGENTASDLLVFWYRDEKDVAYMNISKLVYEGVNEDGSIKQSYLTGHDGEVRSLESLYSYVEIPDNATRGKTAMADFDVVVDQKDIYVIWTQPNTYMDAEGNPIQSREVFASALIQYDEEGSDAEDLATDTSLGCSWSDPYQLTKAKKYTDEPHGVISDSGELMVIYNSYAQTLTGNAENPVEISGFKLNASRMEPCGTIEVTEMTFSDTSPMPGDPVEVQMSVKNVGLTKAADGYTVTVTGPNGIVYEVNSPNKLLPGNTDVYDFAWTVPQSLNDLRLTAVSRENGMTNTHTFESEVLTPSPDYAITTPMVYQDNEGFHLLTTVTNEGNAASREGDVLRVLFVGPYGLESRFEKERQLFAEIPLTDLAPVGDTGGLATSTDISAVLNVIPEAFEQYGFVDCYVAAWNTETEQCLGDGEEIRIMAEKPTVLMLNDRTFPEYMTLRAGASKAFDTTCAPQRLNNNMTVVYSTDNPEVAVFEGNMLHALRPGTVTVTGTVMPYGIETEPITVNVWSGSSGHTEEAETTEVKAAPNTFTVLPAAEDISLPEDVSDPSEGSSDTAADPGIGADNQPDTAPDGEGETDEGQGAAAWLIAAAAGGFAGILAIIIVLIRKKRKI